MQLRDQLPAIPNQGNWFFSCFWLDFILFSQLCTTKAGRDILKAKRTYIILREYDNWEENQQLKEINHDLIQLLIGDEPEPGMENLEQIEIPPRVKERFEKLDEQNPRLKDDDL